MGMVTVMDTVTVTVMGKGQGACEELFRGRN